VSALSLRRPTAARLGVPAFRGPQELRFDASDGGFARVDLLRIVAVVALPVAMLLVGVFGGRLQPTPLQQLAEPYGFDLTQWEIRHLPSKWLHLAGDFFRGDDSREESRATIARYFQLTAEVNQLRGRQDEVVALAGDRSSIDALIEERRAEQAELRPHVEAAIEGELTLLLEELGLTEEVPIFGVETVWPPVDFVLEDTPRVLVTSPRDRIVQSGSLLLNPEVTIEQAEAVEARAARRPNTSGLVVGTGGVAFYPAVVNDRASYEQTLDTAAHEWVHHWLYFHPLGSRYFDGGEIRAINETVANIAGRELAAMLLERLRVEVPGPADGLPAASAGMAPEPIDFRAEMRALRIAVDDLLAAARVAEAEALMEEKRRLFADHGIFIRKINQAYFAFYGTYADTPASGDDPLGPKIEEVRDRSESLAQFLQRMAAVTSQGEIDSILAGG
jgi:hypothetical protein